MEASNSSTTSVADLRSLPVGRLSSASPVGSAEPLLPEVLKGGGGGRGATMLRSLSRADDELQWFRSCLRWVCMDHSASGRAALSWLLFLLLAVVVPATAHFLLAFRPFDALRRCAGSTGSPHARPMRSTFGERSARSHATDMGWEVGLPWIVRSAFDGNQIVRICSQTLNVRKLQNSFSVTLIPM